MKSFNVSIRDGLSLNVYEFGSSGPILHFYHANGFAANVYRSMLENLADDFHVFATDIRGHGLSDKPDHIHSWQELAQDCIEVLNVISPEQPVILLGHSLGAVASMMAAAHSPHRVSSVIAMDPVLFTAPLLITFGLLNRLGLRHLLPPVSGALKRRCEFPSREVVIRTYRSRPVFRQWDPRYMENYARYGFIDSDNGIRLACPRAIEADIYATIPFRIWKTLPRLACPVLILRGSDSETLRPNAFGKALRLNFRIRGQEIDGAGHLFPMEKETEVLNAIRSFMNSQ